MLTAVAYLGSLLAHELGHSLVARRNGLGVEGITLWFLGGVSQLEGDVPGPAAEVRVSGIGPLVSLVLGGVFSLVAWLLQLAAAPGVLVAALAWLGGINLLLAVFNVIPAAPLDGGRLLQAVLWRITGDPLKAAVWAPPGRRCSAGPSSSWRPICPGRRAYNWLWFALLGWFLVSAATAESQQAMLRARLRTVPVRDVMTASPVTVPASATVAQFLGDYLPGHGTPRSRCWTAGSRAGLITVHRASQVPPEARSRTLVRDVACPLAEVARATPDEPVADVLPRLTACSEGRVLVFDGGQLAGIVSSADLSRALDRLSRSSGRLAQPSAEYPGPADRGNSRDPRPIPAPFRSGHHRGSFGESPGAPAKSLSTS